MHAYTLEPLNFNLLPAKLQSLYGISDGHHLLSSVLHCVYFYKETLGSKMPLRVC